ncbi:MAG: radical SAM protein [Nitrospira sp. CR1.3]|nr:radical SAM protein [Nitrospira sp. CR1.3]
MTQYLSRLWTLVKDRPKGWQSLLYNTAMAKAGIAGPLMMPVHISIEPTNLCNARCPVCETGNGSMARKAGMLDVDLYRTFIDEVAPTTAVIMYYFMGEPFLHKRSYEMIRYAREKGIYVETCTNGDFVDAEGTVYSDVNEINFQIGGMTQATHEVYRVRSYIEKIRANIDALLEEKRKHPDSNVQVKVGFIVMKHNEHEVPDFLKWAKEIGVDQANIIDPCVRNLQEAELFLPRDHRYWFYDEEALNRGVLKPKHVPHNECTWVWNTVQLNWDGSVVPCCRDPHGLHLVGNAFERPLREIWNGSEMRHFRQGIVSRQSEVDICRLCSGFGVPRLQHEHSIGFEIKHHTLNTDRLEFLDQVDCSTGGQDLLTIGRRPSG